MNSDESLPSYTDETQPPTYVEFFEETKSKRFEQFFKISSIFFITFVLSGGILFILATNKNL